MNRLEELKREQEVYLSHSKKQKARKEFKEAHKTSFNYAELEYGTKDLSREIEKEERRTNALEYNRKLVFDYMEKTGKSLEEAREHVRPLFKKLCI